MGLKYLLITLVLATNRNNICVATLQYGRIQSDVILKFKIIMKLAKPPLKIASNKRGGTAKTKVQGSRSKENARTGSGYRDPFTQQLGVRQSSANGQNLRPKIQLVPDRATGNMANLKRVKFLDPEFEAPVKDPAAMSAEYMRRKQTLDKNLQKVIDTNRVAPLKVLKKSKTEIEDEKKAHEDELANNPLAKLMESGKPKNAQPVEDDAFADGFIRSKRNTQLRVKQELLSQIRQVEEAKTALIQKLNKALIKLDKQNQTKRELGDKLLESVKFVRDLQRAVSSGDDIEGVVSVQMKTDFQREKELNQRLREELQRCEKERLRLLERIQLLSGEKEIEVEERDGNKRTFKVTQINIQRILDDLRAQKGTAQANEELVSQSQQMVRAAEDEILNRERDIDVVRGEKNELEERFGQLENKYRDTVYLNEGARDHMGGLHRMHVKLLGTRQLEESLKKAFDRTKKNSIDQMLWVTRGYVNQFGAIYRLRNLILHRNSRQAKTALIRWFKLACDPLMLQEQNRQIPEFYAKQHTKSLTFNREFEQWMLSQGLRNQQSSQLDVVKGKISNFWRRELKLRFNMWKDNVRARVSALKVLDKLCGKTKYFETARAFTKWTTYIKEQDFNARLHGMVVMTALNQTQQSVFYGWKTWAHAKKHRRVSILRRSLRNLRIAVQKRKQLQKMALSALGFQIQSDKNIIKQCFDALRQNKEDEKFVYLTDKLTTETMPAIQMLSTGISRVDSKDRHLKTKRATTAFATVFGRIISQYFQKWKNEAKGKAVQCDNNFKIKLIKLYRGKLEKAFNKWRVNRNAMVIEMENMQFEDIQGQNAEIEETCRVNEIKIKALDRSSRNMGAKHIKKLVTAAYQRNMKAYLDRWRKKNGNMNTQVNGAEKIVQKIRRKYLRAAWNRYRKGVADVDQEGRNEHRLDDIKVRLEFKQQKRVYAAIKLFTRRHRTAKRFLKTAINGLDKHNKDNAFRRWKDFRQQEIIMTFENEQGQLVNQMNELTVTDGTVANKLQKSKDKCARVAHTLKTQGQGTLRKWVSRLHNQGMTWAFVTWKKTVKNVGHRESLITSIKKQMVRHTLRQALIRWGQACGQMNICTKQDYIQQENRACQDQKLQVQRMLDEKRNFAVKNGKQLSLVQNEIDKTNAKTENIMARLVSKNQDCFYTSNLNHIFLGWKAYMDRRRKCCQILSSALYKTATQQTFTMINQFARQKDHKNKQEKGSSKLFRLYAKYRYKAAITAWREQEYKNIVMMEMQTTTEMNMIVEDFSVKRENVKKHHVAVRSARVEKNTAQKWFTAWQVYASEERDTRMRTEKLKEALKARAVKKSLQKWKMRSECTIKMRAFFKRGSFVKRKMNLRSCFLAMKQENKNERNMTNKVYAQMENLRNLRLQSAFDLIKRYAAEKFSKNGEKKKKGQDVMIRFLMGFNETKIRAYFYKMRQWKDRCNIREEKMRTAVLNLKNASFRSYFLTWKSKAHQKTIHMQNEEEDGPTNLEAWKLRQENMNLIKLCKEDGMTNKEIHKVHQDKEDQYKAGVEKSLCRMLCKQSDGLSLLPKCLEQWKKYAKIRKIWRRVLDDVKIRTTESDEVSAKLWAFRRMQYSHSDRESCLFGKPIAQLRTQCVNNVEKLDKLADQVEQGENQINELTNQRNLLIKGQVNSQKLALSLSVQNQHRTKMAAMRKFQEYGTQRLQSKIAEAITANLGRITELKNNIQKFETDNEDLARQNDEFRKGATEGISMVRHVESLTNDRDKLSVDLADRALTIRKLLEDNSYLQNKLSSAQNQVATIHSATKKKMDANEAPSRDPAVSITQI